MSEKPQPITPFLPALRRLLQLAGRYKAWLFLAIVVDLFQAVLVVVQADLLRRLFDAVAGQTCPRSSRSRS